MNATQAMDMMKKARKSLLNKRSVLNPNLSAIDAWEIVWRALIDIGPNVKLSAWLETRVRQVCANRFNPDLFDEPPSILDFAVSQPHTTTSTAAILKKNPFKRKFL